MGNGSSKSDPGLDQSASTSRSINANSTDKNKKSRAIKKKSIRAAKKPDIIGIMSEMNAELVLGMIEEMKREKASQKLERRGRISHAA